MVTSTKQVELLIRSLEARQGDRVRPATLCAFRSYFHRWILPRFGPAEIATFRNSTLQFFVSELTTKPLARETVVEVVEVLKYIAASVNDREGNENRPRVWDATLLSVPTVDLGLKKRPIGTRNRIERSIHLSPAPYGALFALLAGTGIRIGECLALRNGDDRVHSCWDSQARLVVIRTSLWRGIEERHKTTYSRREVDIPERFNAFLQAYSRNVSPGAFLFQDPTGSPIDLGTLRQRLRTIGSMGFHAFRRFRVTHLRECGVPEELIRGWLGHASRSSTGRNSKVARNLEARRTWVERASLGFDLPHNEGEPIRHPALVQEGFESANPEA